MCGIIGYTGTRPALPLLLDGLEKLEYRGYDSAGIALVEENRFRVLKRAGKLRKLREALRGVESSASCGIGHTRWATHGAPTDKNAHPHLDCRRRVAVVHNGILENYADLRKRLQSRGHRFSSETDTENLAHLVEGQLAKTKNPLLAVAAALRGVHGSFAAVFSFADHPGVLIAARRGAGGLILGKNEKEVFVASDIPALLSHTRRVYSLEEGEAAFLSPGEVKVVRLEGGREKDIAFQRVEWSAEQAEKSGFPHFMLKEIFEQPKALEETLRGRVDAGRAKVILDLSPLGPPNARRRLSRIFLLACGTSYYAAQVAKFWMEEETALPVEVDYASEFRYRTKVVSPNDLAVVVTQSGETVDTLVALRAAKERGAKTAAVCNVMGSSATREADLVLLTRAGPEIGVASTKAFTTQLACLRLLSLALGAERGLSRASLRREFDGLLQVPAQVAEVLKGASKLEALAGRLAGAKNFLFLGRGLFYPIALEGALKLKEISYLHAEGYPGGEMKHGPIALIDEKLPIVALAPRCSRVYEKMLSNLEEVRARKGRLVAVVEKGDRKAARSAEHVIVLPKLSENAAPITAVVPLQLLAYFIARKLGREIDQPRNLAKSVTVE